jgi:hypothetical protein
MALHSLSSTLFASFRPKVVERPKRGWLVVGAEELPRRHRKAGYALRRHDGCLLLKVYDQTYRRVVAGKWVLFAADGTCVSHMRFFDSVKSQPPIRWADTKIEDRKWLDRS